MFVNRRGYTWNCVSFTGNFDSLEKFVGKFPLGEGEIRINDVDKIN